MHNKNGLTFIELMIATGLMSMVFIIGWGISNTFTGVQKVRNYEHAIAIAAQAIEAIRAARFRELGISKESRKDTLIADFNSANDTFDSESGEAFIPIIKVNGIEYKREINIVDCPVKVDNFPPVLKLVQVRITWKDPEDNIPLIYEAATTVADNH
ncbi:MAG: prepilin-type N-terminal cleavage/methylation domain-containing protein [Candidatus Riflebacteria bacterium]|nr:prepilin-type N-terminal cleavage/methylation domain-containing protein [Candidatus Riflebacteria bacterium]